VKKWRIIPYGVFNAYENMAMDEAVFRGNQQGTSPPTLRFYGWRPSAVSLGYFQIPESEIHISYCTENKIDIVRRPTGGKAVFHDNDLTYSLTSRENTPPFSQGILGTYLTISRCILEGIVKLGIHAEMAETGRSSGDDGPVSHCFSSPSRYELLVKGRKICGSAQTRSNGAFLQHGSLLLRFDPLREASVVTEDAAESAHQASLLGKSVTCLENHMAGPVDPIRLADILKAGFEKILQVRFVEGRLTKEEIAVRDELLQNKYHRDSWKKKGAARVNSR
jgi:lipoate-protein ligase A